MNVKKARRASSIINTAKVEARRWRPPQVDDDWDAVCDAMYKRIERSEWEGLYCEFGVVDEEVNVPYSRESSRAETLWKVKHAKGRGDEYRDQASAI